MLYTISFNLKNGVSEKESCDKASEILSYLKGKIDGLGSAKLYHHHNGANPRYFQMHMEMKDYSTWDQFFAFIEKEDRATNLFQEWRQNMIDLNTHFNELVAET